MCIGRLEPVKNISLLLHAMSRYRCTSFIIGDGSLRSDLEQQTAAQKIQDRVAFLGLGQMLVI